MATLHASIQQGLLDIEQCLTALASEASTGQARHANTSRPSGPTLIPQRGRPASGSPLDAAAEARRLLGIGSGQQDPGDQANVANRLRERLGYGPPVTGGGSSSIALGGAGGVGFRRGGPGLGKGAHTTGGVDGGGGAEDRDSNIDKIAEASNRAPWRRASGWQLGPRRVWKSTWDSRRWMAVAAAARDRT